MTKTEVLMTRWTVAGYSEVAELGRGAAGVVRLAAHDATGQHVAIKYLSEELFADSDFRAGFRTEAQLLGELDSPNVVSLYEYVECHEGAAIVMELVDGVSLRTMLDQQGPTEPEAALSVLKGSLLGLGVAHAVGVVHRDYKPENVLVDAGGESLLTDFGVAARSGGEAVGGTPSYMAPEQWRGEPASPRGDTYAATATFVECLTGCPPFEAPDLELLRKQHERAPIPLDCLPGPVRDLARHGLAKDPGDRPADAGSFLGELEAAARAGYGPDWEERGRASLARRAALLAALFPLAAAGLAGGTAIAATRLGGPPASGPVPAPAGALRRQRAPIAAGIAAGLLIGGATLGLHPTPPGPESADVGTSSQVGGVNPMPPNGGPVPEPPAAAPAPGGTGGLPPETAVQPKSSAPPRSEPKSSPPPRSEPKSHDDPEKPAKPVEDDGGSGSDADPSTTDEIQKPKSKPQPKKLPPQSWPGSGDSGSNGGTKDAISQGGGAGGAAAPPQVSDADSKPKEADPPAKPKSDVVKPKADDDNPKPDTGSGKSDTGSGKTDKSKAEKSGELTKGSGKSGDEIKLN